MLTTSAIEVKNNSGLPAAPLVRIGLSDTRSEDFRPEKNIPTGRYAYDLLFLVEQYDPWPGEPLINGLVLPRRAR